VAGCHFYGRILFGWRSVTIIENFNKVHGTNSTIAKTMGKNAKVMLHQKLTLGYLT
jgi:hypothetical protein